LTKPVIAAAVLTLAEAGKLRLDDPVSKFIPGFAATQVFAGGSQQSSF
jgi:CubicO group peptidase (beta-lactamase class C family)